MTLLGGCVISPNRWTDYQLPALRAMGATLVKIQMHDADARWGIPWFSLPALNDLVQIIGPGGTLILRTPETMIAPETLRTLFGVPLKGSATSLADWIKGLPSYGPGVVIEVGNEPDKANLDAWDHRQRLVNAAGALRGFLPRWVHLVASLATLDGRPGTDQAGLQYNRILLDVGAPARPVLDLYDGLGVHGYGYHSLSRDEADAWAVYDLVAQEGKPIWWTEVGIGHPYPWTQRCAELARWAGALPATVKGAAIFVLDTGPTWVEDNPAAGHVNYALDITPDGTLDPTFAGCHLLAAQSQAAPPPPAPVVTPSTAPGGPQPMGTVPKPPITMHIIGVPPKVPGVGLTLNSSPRTPRGTVLHSMGGTLKGTDGYFPGPQVAALTDFGIGQVDVGGGFAQIIQWCNLDGSLPNRAGYVEPWASGPAAPPDGHPEGDGPAFLAAFGGPGKLNEVGIAVEHDDTTYPDGSFKYGADGKVILGQTPVSAAQWSASCWLQAWLHAEVLGQTADTFQWNMYHYEFCGRGYKTCPNPRITDHTDEHQHAVKAIMRHFQEGAPYPAGGVVVAGLRLALPPDGGDVSGQTPTPKPTPDDRATALKRKAETELPFAYRGNLVQEGEIQVDGIWERAAFYEKATVHWRGQAMSTLFIEGPTCLAELVKAGRVRRF